ncbi:MAG TPA: BMC domain-containing protein [Acidimicrobiia bacterium]
MTGPALALLEFDSIARGIEAGDAMVKRGPVELIVAGTVQPGKFLVLVTGLTADVEEAVEAGRETAGAHLVDTVMLPDVHPGVVDGARGLRLEGAGEALGIIETETVAAVLDAADAGLKGADVTLQELRIADGLGGKGYALFRGSVSEVEAAVSYGLGRISEAQLKQSAVIAQLHHEMLENLIAEARFNRRLQGG